MNRRKLSEPPEPEAETPHNGTTPTTLVQEVQDNDVTTVFRFRDMPSAVLAKGALDSAGIENVMIDDNMVRLDWFISNLVGGVKLQVKLEDKDAALEILNQAIPETFDVKGVGSFEQPRCPKCSSVDITFEALNKPLSYGSAYLCVPIPFPKNTWKCESCGQHWKEVEDPQQMEETNNT